MQTPTPTTSREHRRYCCVVTCRNTSHSRPDLTFFHLPADEKRRNQWMPLIGREDLLRVLTHYRYYTVCEEHFSPDSYIHNYNRKVLNSNALPTLCLPIEVEVNKDLPEMTTSATQTEESGNGNQTIEDKDAKTRKKLLQKPTEQGSRMFFEHLSKTMTRHELSELIKCDEKLSTSKILVNRYDSCRRFCLNLFYGSSQGYRLLQSALRLPNPVTLYKRIEITTEINERLLGALQLKIESMSYIAKPCMAVIDSMPLTPLLSYSEKHDKIVGFQEINGVQTAVAAERALVIIIQGVYVDWHQPIGYALLPNTPSDGLVAQWINDLIGRLCDMGLHFRILNFASKLEAEFFDNRWVSVNTPYCFLKKRKIYYLSDPKVLLNSLRDDLSLYDIHFKTGVAKFEHILSFYNKDKNSQYRLAPNLTESHLYPDDTDKYNGAEVFNKAVASGLSAYIDHREINKSARATVTFIDKISDLCSLFNSSNDVNIEKRVFNGDKSHIKFLDNMKNMLKDIKLIDKKSNENVTHNAKFVRGFLINIHTFKQLSEEFKLEKCTKIPIRTLNQGLTQDFFRQIRLKSTAKPTAEQFGAAFKQLFISKAIKPLKNCKNSEKICPKFIERTKRAIVRQNTTEVLKYLPEIIDVLPCPPDNEDIEIPASDYNHFNSAERHTLIYVSGYLLKKCREIHKDCAAFAKYTADNTSSIAHISRYLQYLETNQICLKTVPFDHFVMIVESYEETFRKTFKRVHIKRPLEETLIKAFMFLEKMNIEPPCPCFPRRYLSRLFIKIRIFYTILLNNREIGRNRRSFVIPLLLSKDKFKRFY